MQYQNKKTWQWKECNRNRTERDEIKIRGEKREREKGMQLERKNIKDKM